MCGRYVLELLGPENLTTRYEAQLHLSQVLRSRFNVAPTQELPVIVRQSPNRVALMRWGLIPSWSKGETGRLSLINARAETVFEKPAFRRPVRRQRCLVPASGFYEWQATPQGKQPFYIHIPDEPLFSFAGLYDIWRDADGHEVGSYAIITTSANAAMASIHDRMPVILPRALEAVWLDPALSEPDQLRPLLAPYPAEQMAAYLVSTAVNRAANDSPALLAPLGAAGANPA